MLCLHHRLPCFPVALDLLVSSALTMFTLFTTPSTPIKASAHESAHRIA
jgi:hypothetical protein